VFGWSTVLHELFTAALAGGGGDVADGAVVDGHVFDLAAAAGERAGLAGVGAVRAGKRAVEVSDVAHLLGELRAGVGVGALGGADGAGGGRCGQAVAHAEVGVIALRSMVPPVFLALSIFFVLVFLAALAVRWRKIAPVEPKRFEPLG